MADSWEKYYKAFDGFYELQNPDEPCGGTEKGTEATHQDIEDIICNSLECGISIDWCGIDNTGPLWEQKPMHMPLSQYVVYLLLTGETVKLFDVEDESERWELTLGKVIEGLMINRRERQEDVPVDEYDSVDTDCVMQYGLFGILVYG